MAAHQQLAVDARYRNLRRRRLVSIYHERLAHSREAKTQLWSSALARALPYRCLSAARFSDDSLRQPLPNLLEKIEYKVNKPYGDVNIVLTNVEHGLSSDEILKQIALNFSEDKQQRIHLVTRNDYISYFKTRLNFNEQLITPYKTSGSYKLSQPYSFLSHREEVIKNLQKTNPS